MGLDVRNSFLRELHELRGVERFGQFNDIEQVMTHASAFLEGGFGCANVQPAIDLHGIHRNDFAAKLLGQQQGDFGFADSCRPSEQQRKRWNVGGSEDGSLGTRERRRVHLPLVLRF
jgi:hypothetical protein